jgi:hypothetical protein
MKDKRRKSQGSRPEQLGLDLPQMKSDAELTAAEIAERITFFERQISSIVKRIAKLRRRRAAIIAGLASGPARMKIDAAAVRARHEELGGARGAVVQLAREFRCSPRTIHRKLG